MKNNIISFIRELKPALALVDRNFNLTKRYLAWESVFILYSIVNALVIGFIGVTMGKDKVMYLVVGALLWGFLSILFHEISESIQWERWEGTIEYTFMAPVHRFVYLSGNCFYAVIYGIARTFLLLLCIALFFGISLKGANLSAAFLVLALSSISFVGLGLIGAVFPLLSTEKGAQATHIFEAVLLLVSGVYYEVSILPGWLRPLSVISPATYTLRAMRAALLDGASIQELYPTLILLMILAVVLVPFGFFVFQLAEKYAKKTGKLKRGG